MREGGLLVDGRRRCESRATVPTRSHSQSPPRRRAPGPRHSLTNASKSPLPLPQPSAREPMRFEYPWYPGCKGGNTPSSKATSRPMGPSTPPRPWGAAHKTTPPQTRSAKAGAEVSDKLLASVAGPRRPFPGRLFKRRTSIPTPSRGWAAGVARAPPVRATSHRTRRPSSRMN